MQSDWFAITRRLADKRLMRGACFAASFALLAGCGPTGRGLADNDLSFKAPAIKRAVRTDQKAAVPELVKSLDDDDSAVRFFAIEGLRRLTNETFGYLYYDDAPARRPAVQRWQQWLKERRP